MANKSAAIAQPSAVFVQSFHFLLAVVPKKFSEITMILREAMKDCPVSVVATLGRCVVRVRLPLIPKAAENAVAKNNLICTPSIPINPPVRWCNLRGVPKSRIRSGARFSEGSVSNASLEHLRAQRTNEVQE